MTAVEILACDDGQIEAVDAPDFVPDESGAEELYANMVSEARYEILRIKDIRLLARVLAIVKNSSELVRVTFDSDELQQVYATA